MENKEGGMSMFCPNCGTDNANGSTFCSNCGATMSAPQAPYTPGQPFGTPPVGPYSVPVAPTYEQPGKGFAIASLVLGIVSIFIFGYIAGALAIIFANVAKNKGNTTKLPTAGLVLGIVGIVGALLVQVFWSSFINSLI